MTLELVSEVFGVCNYFLLKKRCYASWCPEYSLSVAKMKNKGILQANLSETAMKLELYKLAYTDLMTHMAGSVYSCILENDLFFPAVIVPKRRSDFDPSHNNR